MPRFHVHGRTLALAVAISIAGTASLAWAGKPGAAPSAGTTTAPHIVVVPKTEAAQAALARSAARRLAGYESSRSSRPPAPTSTAW